MHQCASNSAAYEYQIAIGCKHGEVDSSYPCTCLSESDLRLYTNFEFYEKKDCKHFPKHVDLQSQAIYVDKNNLEKSLHILQDSASSVQVVILIKYLSKFC